MNLEQVKADLLASKAELKSRLERTHKHIYQKEEPVSANFNEQIKQRENDEIVSFLEQEGLDELKNIESALQRIDDGEYMVCESCGEDIGEERLSAIAYTNQCIKCADSAGS